MSTVNPYTTKYMFWKLDSRPYHYFYLQNVPVITL